MFLNWKKCVYGPSRIEDADSEVAESTQNLGLIGVPAEIYLDLFGGSTT
jgi:hypothetical protein